MLTQGSGFRVPTSTDSSLEARSYTVAGPAADTVVCFLQLQGTCSVGRELGLTRVRIFPSTSDRKRRAEMEGHAGVLPVLVRDLCQEGQEQ